jgi:hypothetical protein
MNDSDVFWATITSNSDTETISGILMPKVRAIEESDPVYYQTDDSSLKDLKERDAALASAIGNNLGGYFSQYIGPNSLYNDVTSPFSYGTVAGRAVTADFSPTVTSIGYFQFPIASNLKLTADLNFKLQFCMSDSESGKSVGIIFRYDIVQTGDAFASPTVTQTNSESLTPPTTQFVMMNHTSANFKIPTAQLASCSNHSLIVCSIQRDITVPNNHAGLFKLAGIVAYQP